eukprot:COSAG02_NODE_34032_length_490_cov_1.271100_1_plen_57_part_01
MHAVIHDMGIFVGRAALLPWRLQFRRQRVWINWCKSAQGCGGGLLVKIGRAPFSHAR